MYELKFLNVSNEKNIG